MLKVQKMNFSFMDVIFLHSGHHPVDGHMSGGENKNIDTIKICLNRSTD